MSQIRVGELSFQQFLEDVFDEWSEEGTLEKVRSFSWVEISIVSQCLIYKRLCSEFIAVTQVTAKKTQNQELSPLF